MPSGKRNWPTTSWSPTSARRDPCAASLGCFGRLGRRRIGPHQRPPRPLRSQPPVGVLQEIDGLLLAHDVGRAVMVEAAAVAPTPLAPTRLSFLTTLRLIRTTFPEFHRTAPADHPRRYRQLLADIVAAPLPPRRHRSSPRVVKRKRSAFRVKGPHHRRWPHPTKAFRDAVVLAK
jgi:hypothetical protein